MTEAAVKFGVRTDLVHDPCLVLSVYAQSTAEMLGFWRHEFTDEIKLEGMAPMYACAVSDQREYVPVQDARHSGVVHVVTCDISSRELKSQGGRSSIVNITFKADGALASVRQRNPSFLNSIIASIVLVHY